MQQSIFVKALVVFVLLASVVEPITADDLADRVDRLEQRLSNNALLGMLERIDRLQSDVRMLRGDLEQVTHSLDGIKKRQQNLYLDLDKRLLDLEKAGVVAIEPGAGPRAKTEDTANVAKETKTQDTVSDTRRREDFPVKPEETVNAAQEGEVEVAVGATGEGLPEVKSETASGIGENTAKDPSDIPGDEKSAYKQVFDQLNEGRYDDAIAGFGLFLSNYPDGDFADNAQYWLGESYYVVRNFDSGTDAFNKVLENYPQSTKVPDAILKMGYIDYEQAQWRNARNKLKTLIKRYPNSIAARLAKDRLKLMAKEGH